MGMVGMLILVTAISGVGGTGIGGLVGALLQKDSTVDFKKVAQSASAGNYEGAKQQMSDFLASKEVQELLKQLENPHE